jgi:predicted aspartyl protease
MTFDIFRRLRIDISNFDAIINHNSNLLSVYHPCCLYALSSTIVIQNQSTMDPLDTTLSDDAKLARDMQMAMNLQAEEHQLEEDLWRGLSRSNNRHDEHEAGGYPTNLTPDHMLFVTCEVEGRLVQMLVDSGASSSAISLDMVKNLGLERHLNRSIQGEASGVGTAKIEGILENVACQIGHVEFRLFFLVLNTHSPWLILGLDQMRRFKCLIDLDSNHIVFGGKDGVSVPFMEQELAAELLARKFQQDRDVAASNIQEQKGKLFGLFGRR